MPLKKKEFLLGKNIRCALCFFFSASVFKFRFRFIIFCFKCDRLYYHSSPERNYFFFHKKIQKKKKKRGLLTANNRIFCFTRFVDNVKEQQTSNP